MIHYVEKYVSIFFQAGSFRWSDGTPVIYTNWDAGEPKNQKGMTQCVALRTAYGIESEWRTFNCDTSKWFFCKVKKGRITCQSRTTYQITFLCVYCLHFACLIFPHIFCVCRHSTMKSIFFLLIGISTVF